MGELRPSNYTLCEMNTYDEIVHLQSEERSRSELYGMAIQSNPGEYSS